MFIAYNSLIGVERRNNLAVKNYINLTTDVK